MSSKKCVVMTFLSAVIILTGLPVGSAAVESSVKVWEEALTLYERAIDLLHNHHFHVREGGGRIHIFI